MNAWHRSGLAPDEPAVYPMKAMKHALGAFTLSLVAVVGLAGPAFADGGADELEKGRLALLEALVGGLQYTPTKDASEKAKAAAQSVSAAPDLAEGSKALEERAQRTLDLAMRWDGYEGMRRLASEGRLDPEAMKPFLESVNALAVELGLPQDRIQLLLETFLKQTQPPQLSKEEQDKLKAKMEALKKKLESGDTLQKQAAGEVDGILQRLNSGDAEGASQMWAKFYNNDSMRDVRFNSAFYTEINELDKGFQPNLFVDKRKELAEGLDKPVPDIKKKEKEGSGGSLMKKALVTTAATAAAIIAAVFGAPVWVIGGLIVVGVVGLVLTVKEAIAYANRLKEDAAKRLRGE